jgi:aconitate hydratase
MRNVAADIGKNPKAIEPLVPVDLVVDHSVMIDYYGTPDALDLNMKLEFDRNSERYQFMKWGMQAFDTFKVVPPGIGIVHQVNLEYLARGVHQKDGVYYPDTLVGTDSHTTMINGIGVVGWGVGGIEAEAGMLGQPLYILTPDVVGVELKGKLPEGATATDLVLTVTELLRKEKVVGKFVEFFGEGTSTLAVPDRATIGNMAPEYGATMGFFPVDDATVDYLRATGRTDAEIDAFESYFKAQKMFGIPRAGEIDYTKVVSLDLASVRPSLAGPKRPQDRIELGNLKSQFTSLFSKPAAENGFSKKPDELARRFHITLTTGRGAISDASQQAPNGAPRDVVEMVNNRPTTDRVTPAKPQPADIGSGDVLIAAITSCTNTSNPSVMLAAGPPREEGGREGPVDQAARQDVARSRLARRHGLPDQDGSFALPGEARIQRRSVRLHHVHRQRRRPRSGDQRRDRHQRSGLRRRAVGQPQLRGAHPSEPQGEFSWARRRSSSPTRSPARCSRTSPPSRSARARTGRCS